MSENAAVEDAISTLEGWLPNECREYAELVARLLASLPGGEELEELGFEPFPYLGWQEADMLGRLLVTVRDSGDVAEAARRLFYPAKGDTLHDDSDDDGEGVTRPCGRASASKTTPRRGEGSHRPTISNRVKAAGPRPTGSLQSRLLAVQRGHFRR